MPQLKKGSKQAKDYMSKIRAMKGTKNSRISMVIKGQYKATPNKSKKTFTITNSNGSIFRTIPMSKKEFEEALYWSSNDWANFMKTDEYYSLSGYTKGSTRFIEQGEKPVKGKTNYRVKRNETTLLTKGGTFKNFTKIGAIDLNIIGKELMELESDINELKNFIQREKLIKEKNRLKDILKVKNNQFKTLKMYLNSIAQFTYKQR